MTPPVLPRPLRAAGVPLGVIIALGVLVGILVSASSAVNPAGTTIGVLLASIAMAVVVASYLWLDRWEPEPPRLLVFAFLWGASIAAIASLGLEWLAGIALDGGLGPARSGSDVLAPVLVAPVVEEALKGSILLIVMTGRRRHQVNSTTDCLVYAGLAAAGFAWLEDVFYVADGKTLAASLATALLRLVMGPFAHPLFTSMTALGVAAALNRRNRWAKLGCVAAGYAAAVGMHALWNGSSLLGFATYLLVYALWMVPIFALTVWLATYGRRREQRVVASMLPGMVADWLITPNEATWLGSIRARKIAIAAAGRAWGPPAARTVSLFAARVVALAFVRQTVSRTGWADARLAALHAEDVGELLRARATAPVLAAMAGYRIG